MAFIENLLTILAPSTGDPLGRIVIRYMDRNTFVYTIFNIYILLESPPPPPVSSSTLTDWLTELTPLLSLSLSLTDCLSSPLLLQLLLEICFQPSGFS